MELFRENLFLFFFLSPPQLDQGGEGEKFRSNDNRPVEYEIVGRFVFGIHTHTREHARTHRINSLVSSRINVSNILIVVPERNMSDESCSIRGTVNVGSSRKITRVNYVGLEKCSERDIFLPFK